MDLPLKGASFTWFRDLGIDCMSRIDRTLVSVDWVRSFWKRVSKGTPSCSFLIIAHFWWWLVVLIKVEVPLSLRMWLKEKGFVERVRQWWNRCCFAGSPSFILAHKIKALKEDLKKWNKEVFRDLPFRKKCLLFELLGLDVREDLLGLSQVEQTRRIQIKTEIAHLPSLEEISWRQKSRILFVKEGDNNTHFFHWVANSHRRINHIRGLRWFSFIRVCTLSQVPGALLWVD